MGRSWLRLGFFSVSWRLGERQNLPPGTLKGSLQCVLAALCHDFWCSWLRLGFFSVSWRLGERQTSDTLEYHHTQDRQHTRSGDAPEHIHHHHTQDRQHTQHIHHHLHIQHTQHTQHQSWNSAGCHKVRTLRDLRLYFRIPDVSLQDLSSGCISESQTSPCRISAPAVCPSPRERQQ